MPTTRVDLVDPPVPALGAGLLLALAAGLLALAAGLLLALAAGLLALADALAAGLLALGAGLPAALPVVLVPPHAAMTSMANSGAAMIPRGSFILTSTANLPDSAASIIQERAIEASGSTQRPT
ncbi:MAG: hypothetical protein ACYDAG_02765 [Chloroflexota bacterium]